MISTLFSAAGIVRRDLNVKFRIRVIKPQLTLSGVAANGSVTAKTDVLVNFGTVNGSITASNLVSLNDTVVNSVIDGTAGVDFVRIFDGYN